MTPRICVCRVKQRVATCSNTFIELQDQPSPVTCWSTSSVSMSSFSTAVTFTGAEELVDSGSLTPPAEVLANASKARTVDEDED